VSHREVGFPAPFRHLLPVKLPRFTALCCVAGLSADAGHVSGAEQAIMDAIAVPRSNARQQLSVLVSAMAAKSEREVVTPVESRSPILAERATVAASELPPILLPKVIVQEQRVAPLEREVLTSKGRLEAAQKKYLSPVYQTTLGPLVQVASYYFQPLSLLGGWRPNEAEAMTLYWEDDRRRILKDMDSLIELETDRKRLNELRRVRQQTRTDGVNAREW
jgi:hypothetical protein